MLHIAICDDNNQDLQQIKQIVMQIPDMQLTIHEYTDPNQCLKDIENGLYFDTFLLDILMNEDNGIEIARTIRKTHPTTPLFFITATPEYALQGYEVNALRYVLKPIDIPRLQNDLTTLFKHLHFKKNSFLSVSTSKGVFKVKISDIYYIESMLRTIQIHTKDECYSTTGKIGELEETLKQNDFVRVHKSFLVNLAYIKNIFKDTITLDNDQTILLSKHRSKETHAKLLNYVKDNI